MRSVASGSESHAEGTRTTASAQNAHAEGSKTIASGVDAHTEGAETEASGLSAHAEGNVTTASGQSAHAEGMRSVASGSESHAQNWRTKASSFAQTAIGKCNIEDTTDKYALIIGNGTADDARSNALTVDWNGNVQAAGGLTLAGHSSEVGTRITVSGSSSMSNVSQTADAYPTIGTISLPAGTWIVVCRGNFAPSASTGNNYPAIYVTSSSSGTGWHSRGFTQGATNARLTMTIILSPTATTTYYLKGYSNTAGSWTRQNAVQFTIDAVRLV